MNIYSMTAAEGFYTADRKNYRQQRDVESVGKILGLFTKNPLQVAVSMLE